MINLMISPEGKLIEPNWTVSSELKELTNTQTRVVMHETWLRELHQAFLQVVAEVTRLHLHVLL